MSAVDQFQTVAPYKRFDALWCSEDNSVRVSTHDGEHFVSVNGGPFLGPHKTLKAAKEYGAVKAKGGDV